MTDEPTLFDFLVAPPESPPAAAAMPSGPPVEVIRSPKRRKTVSARMVDGVLRVMIPARMSKADEKKWVDDMVARVTRKTSAGEIDLAERAETLARRYGMPLPRSIRWVSNQESRWGSCTPADATIRISDRVARFPAWVVDAVIVHELAHLVVESHGPAFWDVANRYPLTERARGFLIAKGGEDPD